MVEMYLFISLVSFLIMCISSGWAGLLVLAFYVISWSAFVWLVGGNR